MGNIELLKRAGLPRIGARPGLEFHTDHPLPHWEWDKVRWGSDPTRTHLKPVFQFCSMLGLHRRDVCNHRG